MRRLTALAALVLLSACGGRSDAPSGALFEVYRDRSVPIGSAALFDPARYLGTWYEVARFPVPFEADCVAARADYGLNPDGSLSVLNTCTRADGSTRDIVGQAEIVGPGRLKVSFDSIPFLRSDYWVLWVDEGYRTAVVGAPDGQSGWILNRDPQIPQDRLVAAREVLDFNGYDVDRLIPVGQGN